MLNCEKKGENCPGNIWQTALFPCFVREKNSIGKLFLAARLIGGGGRCKIFFRFFCVCILCCELLMRMTMDCFSHTFLLLLFSSHLPSSRKRAKKRIRQEEKHSWHITLRGQTGKVQRLFSKKIFSTWSLIWALFFSISRLVTPRCSAHARRDTWRPPSTWSAGARTSITRMKW